jgi:hypothetical protein
MRLPKTNQQLYTSLALVMLFVAPVSSTNYKLDEYSFGGGGTDQTSSTNYSIEGINKDTAENQLESANYQLGPELLFAQMANVPTGTLSNDADWYNKLKLIINTAGNPSDTTYAVAISIDNFATTRYIQSDFTVGDTLGLEDWQTYTAWGGASGVTIVGLQADTTYYIKVKSQQGDFTEGPWGPVATASTNPPNISFDIDVSAIDEETSSPYAVDLGELEPGNVVTGSDYIWLDLATNAEGGANIFARGENGGLHSLRTSHTIPSNSTNLATANEGFGLQVSSVAQSSGGPLVADPPYNGSNDVVGAISTSYESLLSAIGSPIVGGRGSVHAKAIITDITPAANDYEELLTLIAVATF